MSAPVFIDQNNLKMSESDGGGTILALLYALLCAGSPL